MAFAAAVFHTSKKSEAASVTLTVQTSKGAQTTYDGSSEESSKGFGVGVEEDAFIFPLFWNEVPVGA